MTYDGRWSYVWDAENRLVEMVATDLTVAGGHPPTKLQFVYDWQGRRIARHVWQGGIQGNPTFKSSTRWLYDGWNVVAQFTSMSTTGTTMLRNAVFTWGPDLSGTLQGAGGVGGLLMQSNGAGTVLERASYDGNGNIVAWTKSNASAPTSRREYDAFGNTLVSEGAAPSTFGFSTKMQDAETGLYYYGYRFYDPVTGRWPSRDPIGEEGGVNLYAFVSNNSISNVDSDGRINFPGMAIGVGWELAIQITANVASGEDWYKIDVADVVIAGAVGALFPGAGGILKGTVKGLAKQEKAIRAGAKAMARAKGNLRKGKLLAKAREAAKAEKQAWKDVMKIGAGVAAAKIAGKVAETAADAIEEHFAGECPPQINEVANEMLPPIYVSIDRETGEVIEVSDQPLGGDPIDFDNPPPFVRPSSVPSVIQ